MRRSRFVSAFAVAPAAATALLWSLMSGAHEPLNAAFCFSALVYAYLVAGVLVVPAYILTSSQNLRAPYGNALVGALAGLVPAGLLYVVTTQVFFVVSIVVASAFGGLVFGLIAGRHLAATRRPR